MSLFNSLPSTQNETSENSQVQFSQLLFSTQDIYKTQYSQNFFGTQSSVKNSQNYLFDNEIFPQPSQHYYSQTFNNFTKASQQPIASQNLITRAATTHSKLTIDFNLREVIDRKIPQSIVELHNDVVKEHFSEWTFISILTGQLCTNKFPMGSYHNFKLALLMSLVTSSENPLHIMAVGSEMSNANLIMCEIGELAERFIPVTNKTSDGIVIKKNGTYEAGSLVMATNGISFIGYWDQLKPKIKTQLIREIETNTLLVQKAQKYFTLESTVWAHWNYAKKVKKDIAALDQFLK